MYSSNVFDNISPHYEALANELKKQVAELKLFVTTQLNNMASNKIGSIVMWNGPLSSIPDGWHICDGTNGTPDLRDRFIQGAGGAFKQGHYIEAGLPNIVGSFGIQDNYNWEGLSGWSGALYKGAYYGSPDGRGGGHRDSWNYYGFDASRSNATYGKSDTVQPPSYCLYFIMKIS